MSHAGFALCRHQLKAFPGWGERQGPTLASDKDISLKGGTFPQGTSAVKEGPRHVDHEARASWSRTVSAECLQVQHISLSAGQESKETEDLVPATWHKEHLESHSQAKATSGKTNRANTAG